MVEAEKCQEDSAKVEKEALASDPYLRNKLPSASYLQHYAVLVSNGQILVIRRARQLCMVWLVLIFLIGVLSCWGSTYSVS
jgi:hypothetical protein